MINKIQLNSSSKKITKLLFILIFSFFFTKQVSSVENKIEFKINNEIITTIDILNEIKLLTSLNPKLLELDNDKIKKISSDSLIKEKIKKIEIQKYKKEMEIDEKYLSQLIKNSYEKINISSEEEFINFLDSKELEYKKFKTKLAIEALWNELIFIKFRTKIKIDKNKIKKELAKADNMEILSYNLSEILFNLKKGEQVNKKFETIKKDIEEKGFSNAALMHSISSSSKLGGKLGWIDATALNKKLNKKVSILSIGDFTDPFILPGGFLILKLNNLKKIKKKFDINEELNKVIKIKSNEQLNQFSNIYFNKIKKDIKIDKI